MHFDKLWRAACVGLGSRRETETTRTDARLGSARTRASENHYTANVFGIESNREHPVNAELLICWSLSDFSSLRQPHMAWNRKISSAQRQAFPSVFFQTFDFGQDGPRWPASLPRQGQDRTGAVQDMQKTG